jgi:methionine synthase reductase
MKDVKFGETWLFFGCRHKERDFLYRKKLEKFVADGTLTHLCVSFSRDEGQAPDAPKYVQHNMKRHGAALTELIVKQTASIFVCGDAKNMAKEVMKALSEILSESTSMSENDAHDFLRSLRDAKRYCEDVWT